MSTTPTEPVAPPHKAPKKQAVQQDATPEPIILDMGKKKRKQVRKLRKGKPGSLMNRVEEALEHLRENGAVGKDAQPVVIVVKEKKRNKGRRFGKMWGLG